jgi:hypothetical protein
MRRPHICHQSNLLELILSFRGKIKRFEDPDPSLDISAFIDDCPELKVPLHVGAIHNGICYLPDYEKVGTLFKDSATEAHVTLVKGKTNFPCFY